MPPSSLHIVEYLSCPGSMSLTSFTSSRLTHRREVLHPDVPAHVQVLLHRRGVGGREHEVSATFDYVPRRTEMEVIQRCSSLGHRMILSPTDSTDFVQVPMTAPACAGSSERRAASAGEPTSTVASPGTTPVSLYPATSAANPSLSSVARPRSSMTRAPMPSPCFLLRRLRQPPAQRPSWQEAGQRETTCHRRHLLRRR